MIDWLFREWILCLCSTLLTLQSFLSLLCPTPGLKKGVPYSGIIKLWKRETAFSQSFLYFSSYYFFLIINNEPTVKVSCPAGYATLKITNCFTTYSLWVAIHRTIAVCHLYYLSLTVVFHSFLGHTVEIKTQVQELTSLCLRPLFSFLSKYPAIIYLSRDSCIYIN